MAGSVFCPTCGVMVPLDDEADVQVELRPTVVTLGLDGSLDLGMRDDVYLDYWHMTCGTKVRLGSNAIWDGEGYGPDPNPMIEIDPGGSNLQPSLLDGAVISADGHDVWRQSLDAMFALLDEARARHEERQK